MLAAIEENVSGMPALSQREVTEKLQAWGEGVAPARTWQVRIVMNSERWREVKELFDAALQREPSQRAAFLDAACDDDGKRKFSGIMQKPHELRAQRHT